MEQGGYFATSAMAKRPTSEPKTTTVSTVDVPPAKPLDMSCVQSARSSNASLFLISTIKSATNIVSLHSSHLLVSYLYNFTTLTDEDTVYLFLFSQASPKGRCSVLINKWKPSAVFSK